MKKSIFKKIGGLFLGLSMGLGVVTGVAAGNKASEVKAESTLTFSTTSSEFSKSTNTSHTYDGKYTLTFSELSAVSASTVQMKKSTTLIHSGTAIPGDITNLRFTNCSTSSTSGFSVTAYGSTDGSNWVQTNSCSSIPSNKTVDLSFSGSYRYFKLQNGTSRTFVFSSLVVTYKSSTPVTSLSLSGTDVSNNAISIGSSDTAAHTINVAITSGATDQKVNVAHQSGSSLVSINSSQITCSSGSGSFTITGKGLTSGTETIRVSANSETSVYQDLVITALNDSVTYYTVTFNSNGGSSTPANMQVEENKTFTFPSPGTKDHHTFNGWSSDGGTTKYLSGVASPTITSNTDYTAYWTEDAKYNVTYIAGTHGSGSKDVLNQYAGDYTLLEFDDLTEISAASGYKFKDYTVNGVNKNPGDTISLSNTTTVTVNFEERPLETTYDFVTNFKTYKENWGNTDKPSSYLSRSGMTYNDDLLGEYDATINLYYASNQTSTITDRPVFATKTGEGSWTNIIDFTLNDSQYQIVGVTVTFVQWGSKTPDVALFSGTGSSGTPISTMTIGGSSLQLSADLDNVTSFSVGYCDKAGSNIQSGLTSIYVQLAAAKTLTSISVESDTHRSFDLGAEFVGETIYANYSSGDPVDVTNSVTYTGYDMNTLGDQTVTVSYSDSYGSDTETYTINIHYATVTKVELSTNEVYLGVGETFDLSEIVVTITPENADQDTYSWSVAEDDGALATEDYTFSSSEKTLTAKQVEGYVKLQCTAGSQTADFTIHITAGPSASFLVSEIEGIANVTQAEEMTVNVANYKSITSYTWEIEENYPEVEGKDVVQITTTNSATTTVSFKNEGIATVKVTVALINNEDVSDSVTASFDVYVTKQLDHIVASLKDDTKKYAENTNVPASDITVTKVYSDGQEANASEFTVTEPLVTLSDTSIKVSYTESEITRTTDVTVSVVKAQLSSLSFTNKTLNQFKEGDAVNGVFSLGSKATITAKYATSFDDETVVTDGELQSGIRGELRFELCSRTGTSSYTYTKVTDIEIGDPMLRSYNGLYLRAFYKYDNQVVADAAQVTVAAPDVQVAVEEIADDGYSLVTNVTQLKANDEILIVSHDSSIGMQAYVSGNNCKGTAVTKSSDKSTLSAIGDATKLTISDAGDGKFYIYDGAKYLYAASSSGNQLKGKAETDSTNGAFRFTYANGYMTIVAEGSSNRNQVYYNANNGSPIFAAYGSKTSSYEYLDVYKYTKGGPEDKYYTCSESLYDAIAASQALLDTECLAKDVQESTWATISGYFSSFTSGDDYKILTKGKSLSQLSSGNIAEDFLARYDQIVHDYGYDNFLGRAKISPSRVNPIIALGNIESSTWIIAVIAVSGLTAIGGYFFYRKRKEI